MTKITIHDGMLISIAAAVLALSIVAGSATWALTGNQPDPYGQPSVCIAKPMPQVTAGMAGR